MKYLIVAAIATFSLTSCGSEPAGGGATIEYTECFQMAGSTQWITAVYWSDGTTSTLEGC